MPRLLVMGAAEDDPQRAVALCGPAAAMIRTVPTYRSKSATPAEYQLFVARFTQGLHCQRGSEGYIPRVLRRNTIRAAKLLELIAIRAKKSAL